MTTKFDRTMIDGSHLSVDTDTDNNLRITAWDHNTSDLGSGHILVIPPNALPAFLRDVASHIGVALAAVDTARQYGDCATCRNARLVDQPVKGQDRTVSVHCPDCRGKHHPEAFTAYPRVGGGLTDGGIRS